MRFYVDEEGRWSGGGNAFLNNAHHATERHAILQGKPGRDIPIIARNTPTRTAWPRGQHVLAPQNAWPWNPISSGLRETTHVLALRAATEISLMRAHAMLRISSAIPAPTHIPTSPTIHNVLDVGFEEALLASAQMKSPWPGQLISIGSGHAYRNIPGLLRGYRAYREMGGNTPMTIAGPAGPKSAIADAKKAAEGLSGVTFIYNSIPRPVCLAAMRDASAVILPSRVEASPVTALEACAVTPRIVLGDILANREILATYGSSVESESAFADPTSPTQIAHAILRSEQGGAGNAWHGPLSDATVRSEARNHWGDHLATWLETLNSQWERTG